MHLLLFFPVVFSVSASSSGRGATAPRRPPPHSPIAAAPRARVCNIKCEERFPITPFYLHRSFHNKALAPRRGTPSVHAPPPPPQRHASEGGGRCSYTSPEPRRRGVSAATPAPLPLPPPPPPERTRRAPQQPQPPPAPPPPQQRSAPATAAASSAPAAATAPPASATSFKFEKISAEGSSEDAVSTLNRSRKPPAAVWRCCVVMMACRFCREQLPAASSPCRQTGGCGGASCPSSWRVAAHTAARRVRACSSGMQQRAAAHARTHLLLLRRPARTASSTRLELLKDLPSC